MVGNREKLLRVVVPRFLTPPRGRFLRPFYFLFTVSDIFRPEQTFLSLKAWCYLTKFILGYVKSVNKEVKKIQTVFSGMRKVENNLLI